MLSRVANHIYWMQRYRERAENLARLLEVNFILNMDVPNTKMQWEPLLKTSGDEELFKKRGQPVDRSNVLHFLTFDKEYAGSILNCIRNARENARAVREIIPTDLWHELNTAYLFVQKSSTTRMSIEHTHHFYSRIIRQCQLFTGIADTTMSHGKAWHFGRMGYLLERADMTSRILDVKYFLLLLPSAYEVGSPLDNVQWGALLKSASALDMYRQNRRSIRHDYVIDFLVRDREFPRSIYSCLSRMDDSLNALIQSSENKRAREPAAHLKALLTELRKTSHDAIIAEGLHEFLDRLQLRLIDLDASIHGAFFGMGDPA